MVFPIPENLPSAIAAPMLCAGLTVYSPLVRSKVSAGSRVGIVGIGGLGHFAIMFAKALGAEVTAISHTSSKSADATKMGASHFIATNTDNWSEPHARSLDIILCTSFAKDYPLEEYLSMLDIGGTMIYVGIPESALPPLPPTLMIGNNSALRGSNTGSKKEVIEMLKLAADQGIKSWVEELPMEKCVEAIEKLTRGEARYRIVLKV
jgi:alcohol dehydrogenase (NADP+)